MKKNKMMRIASVLLVAVLLSTCAISGTFAKYVTQVSGNDSARVAKWGITSDLAETSTFSKTYASGMVAVNSNETVNVVAPGTSDSGTYKITGAPEVKYTVTFEATAVADIFLAAGNYDCSDNAGTRVVAENIAESGKYYPLKWTVTLGAEKADVSGTGAIVKGKNDYNTLAEAIAAINNTTLTYEANEECELTLTIAWSWAFENQYANGALCDDADTVLANIAAGTYRTNAEHSINVEYELDITVTQVDTGDDGTGNNDIPAESPS